MVSRTGAAGKELLDADAVMGTIDGNSSVLLQDVVTDSRAVCAASQGISYQERIQKISVLSSP